MIIDCPECGGDQTFETCTICGEGIENCDHDHTDGKDIAWVDCDTCDAAGEIDDEDEEGL